MTTASPMPSTRRLSLAEKIGQLVMIDFSGPELPDGLREGFARFHWGGIILFVKNIHHREQVMALCDSLQAARGGEWPLFIGVDQEGGIVDRLAFDALASSPGAMALAATDDATLAGQVARINAEELRRIGFNVNFAPCVDVNNNPLNPVIGVRAYGEDAAQVTRFGREVARGYREGGVIPCAKHFPGHGDTSLDSHLAMPAVEFDRARLDAVELAPYRALISDGLEMIMTAHIVYPTLDPSRMPATLSAPILSGLLRGELGFEGVIITDSMSMKAVADHYGTGQAAVMAVQAGADVVLACGTSQAQEETWRALHEAVETGVLSESRIDASIQRIAVLKARLAEQGARREPSASERSSAIELIERAARGSITMVQNDGTLPLRKGQRVLLVAPSLLPVSQLGEIGTPFPLGDLLRAQALEVDERRFSLTDEAGAMPDDLDTAPCDVIVLALYARGRLSADQQALARRLAGRGRPMAVVSLNSPYIRMDIPSVAAYLCSYGYARSSMQALAEVLGGVTEAGGRLPVSIPSSKTSQ